jgi:hypothetical protein
MTAAFTDSQPPSQAENSELRALCAELRETKGLLDYIKMQHALTRPPQ